MKEKFIKSSIVLIIGGLLIKLLGMFIRIMINRIAPLETISLYMLILPTFSLMMAISQLGFSTSISKLVSEERYKNKKLLFSILPISIFINIALTIFLVFASRFIANTLLKNPNAYLPILAISLVLPFDSMSSILRGFFFGHEKMVPHIISQLCEQITRLVLIMITIPYLVNINYVYATVGLVLVNVFSELSASLILFLFLPRSFTITKDDLKPNYLYIKDVLNISLPTTTSRIVGTIGYFFEPVILTFVLLKDGYTSSYITIQYGIINAYIMPMVLFPSFFTNAISHAMLPIISREYAKGNKKYIKTKLWQTIIFSLIIGVPISIVMFIFPEFFLKLFYKTQSGINYLRFLIPFFLLYYIETPLAMFLQGINKSYRVMTDNIIGIIIKTVLLFLLSFLNIGLYSLLIATISNIIIVTIRHIISIKKSLQN